MLGFVDLNHRTLSPTMSYGVIPKKFKDISIFLKVNLSLCDQAGFCIFMENPLLKSLVFQELIAEIYHSNFVLLGSSCDSKSNSNFNSYANSHGQY